MTAAHCTCQLKSDDPHEQPQSHPNSLCKPYHTNQITSGFNEINVYGGYMSIDKLESAENRKHSFIILYAFVKDVDVNNLHTGTAFVKSDIAILISDRAFFEKSKLIDTMPLERPPMLPICLAAKDSNFNNEKIMGVGWGLIYDESPGDDPSVDPIYSSCMTDEVGPKKWRFEHCDIQQLKKNNWSCEKTRYPDEVEKLRSMCKNVFEEVKRLHEGIEIGNIDRLDKIHIYENDRNQPIYICYNEKNLSEKGWCMVNGVDPLKNPGAWGFCSPSCDKEFLQVEK